MLITIIIAVVYGLLVTFLVHPWYIKGILKKKTLYKNYKDYYDFPLILKNMIYIFSFITFSFIFLLTLAFYSDGHCIFVQFAPIILIIAIPMLQCGYGPLIYQFISIKEFKKHIILIITIFIILLFINIPYKFKDINIPNLNETTKDMFDISYFIPISEIKFNAEIDIHYYSDENIDYYLFNNGNQSKITIIDNKSINTSKNLFINENLVLNIWNDNIRSIFKYEKITPYGIIITDDNTVYKVFYVINTNGEFSNFVLKDISNNSDIIIL